MSVVLLLLAACSPHIVEEAAQSPSLPGPAQPAEIGLGELSGAVELRLEAPAECINPCSFSSTTAGPVHSVRYDADGWLLGTGSGEDHVLSYSFNSLGLRWITATALDEEGRVLATSSAAVEVDANRVELLAEDCDNPCTFAAEVGGEVDAVVYDADGWLLGTGAGPDHELSYTFHSTGLRRITARGLAADGVELASASAELWVGAQDLELPYFYQYANALHPSSSCQNTSLAMLLSGFGWSGDPDDITAVWGKDYAQSPWGLADLFNVEAEAAGISARLTAHVDGTLEGMRGLLDEGKPVILHGYFTSYGHVLVVLGYDEDSYLVNDPAGTWSQSFMGGYPYGWEPTAGEAIRYDRAAFEAAASTVDGWTVEPMWYHELSVPL